MEYRDENSFLCAEHLDGPLPSQGCTRVKIVPAFICEPALPSHHDSSHNTLLKYIWVKSYLMSPHVYLNFSTAVSNTSSKQRSFKAVELHRSQSSVYYGPQTLQLKELLLHLTTLIGLEVNNCFGLSAPETSSKLQPRA